MPSVFPLFGLNTKGKSPTVTTQRHLNLYAELQREAEKAKVVFYGTPGLDLFSDDLGDSPIRGWIAVGSLFYLVHRGTFYEVNNAGVITSRGTLNTTSGQVDMAYNGTLIIVVDGTNGYTYTISSTTFAQIADGDFPNGANTCSWLDGQFIVDDGSGSDAFYISPTGTAWDATDFATAESNPDGLVRVFADNGEVVLCGEQTTEYWGNTGAADFPFAPINGATQEFGLAARWSLSPFNSGLAGLFKPRGGQVQVMYISGYVPRPISSPEMDFEINSYSAVSDAVAYSYNLGGHPMLQINFPTAGKSWLYDAASGLWSPLEYGLYGERHRGQLQLNFLSQTLIADYENGSIYILNPETYTDNGTQIAREIIGRHVFRGNDRIVVDELYVDMETGVGIAQASTPVNYLSLPGSTGNYASTPDSAAVSITGDIDIRIKLSMDDWTPSVTSALLAHHGTDATTGRGYFVQIGTTGLMGIVWSTDGTIATQSTKQSTVAPSVSNGSVAYLRFVLDVDNGAAGHDAKFYESSDEGDTWDQVGTTVTTAGTTSIFDSSAELRISSTSAAPTTNHLAGDVYWAEVRSGIDGAIKASFIADNFAVGGTSALGSQGETWTVNQSGSPAAEIEETTVADTVGANPQAMLRISKDNGHTWGAFLRAGMGAMGKYLTRLSWRRLGVARDFTFSIRITDPVKVVMTYAALRARS